jgi:hypothetical protein
MIPLLGNQNLLLRIFVRLLLRLPDAVLALWTGQHLGLARSSLGKEKSRIASS